MSRKVVWFGALVVLLTVAGGFVLFDYPVPVKFLQSYMKTQLKILFAREDEPVGAALAYLKGVVGGDNEQVARFVVLSGREEALRHANENKIYFDSYGLRIKLIRFEPENMNIISPDEMVFTARVELLVVSPYWTELESLRWGVAMVRENDGWKVASADVFGRETEMVRVRL